MIRKARFQYAFIGIVAISLFSAVAAKPASATSVDWTTWSSNSAGTISGLGITITYSGQMDGLSAGYPSWTPTSTFSGGTVGNPPPSSGGMIVLTGGTPTVDTITFSTPVVNPVMAIWSLGQGGISASFNFTANEPFTIESGGPSAEYGGSTILVCSGKAVCGAEGNGTIQFQGTFSTISWTNPVFENYYGFTIGAPSSTSVVPEPASVLLVASGLAGVLRLRGRKAAPRG
jgi:PEP-CTERM motif